MKILLHTNDKAEAQQLKFRFEQNGIPIFIGSENSGPALGYVMADKFTVWACIDEQIDEALKLLENPDYEVQNPVDVENFHRALGESANELKSFISVDRVLLVLVLSVILSFIYWIYKNGAFT